MTAAELHALVQNWPEEAKAKGTRYIGQPDPDKPDYPDCWAAELSANMTSCLHTHHAISLHVASGIEYLIGEGFHSFIFDCGDTDVTDPSLTLYDTTVHGKTTIELISSAITATKGNV